MKFLSNFLGIHQFRCVQIFPYHRKTSRDRILQWSTDWPFTCRWVKVCGATFGERICSQPQWSCYALPFSSTCSASTGRYDVMLGVCIFCDGTFLVLCHMTICGLFEDYMFESSFENVIIWNRQQNMSLFLFLFCDSGVIRPFWFNGTGAKYIYGHFWGL